MQKTLCLILLAALFNANAQALLKKVSVGHPFRNGINAAVFWGLLFDPFVLISLVFYVLSFFLSIKIYEEAELVFVSPVFMGLVFLTVSLYAVLVFGETITVNKVLGMGAVLLGIGLISL